MNNEEPIPEVIKSMYLLLMELSKEDLIIMLIEKMIEFEMYKALIKKEN